MALLPGVWACDLVAALNRIQADAVLSIDEDGNLLVSSKTPPEQPIFKIFRDTNGEVQIERTAYGNTSDGKNMLDELKPKDAID